VSTATAPALEDRPAVDPDEPQPDENPDTGGNPGEPTTETPAEGEPGNPQVEPDQPAEPDNPEPDPDREAVQASEPSRAQLRELDGELEHFRERVHEVMGAFVAGMVDCETCNGLGLRPPDPAPRSHPWFKTCPTCAGYGEVLTGSRDEQHLGVNCPRCAGRGYLEGLDASGSPLSELAKQPGALTIAAAATAGELEPDQWPPDPAAEHVPAEHGTPAWMGDPNLGR
jgi:hypothetical protein